jgi:hypothetical protein
MHLSATRLMNFVVDPFKLNEKEIQALGAPLNSTKFPEHVGGGYMANLAVFHQLHCLVCSVGEQSRALILIFKTDKSRKPSGSTLTLIITNRDYRCFKRKTGLYMTT